MRCVQNIHNILKKQIGKYDKVYKGCSFLPKFVKSNCWVLSVVQWKWRSFNLDFISERVIWKSRDTALKYLCMVSNTWQILTLVYGKRYSGLLHFSSFYLCWSFWHRIYKESFLKETQRLNLKTVMHLWMKSSFLESLFAQEINLEKVSFGAK